MAYTGKRLDKIFLISDVVVSRNIRLVLCFG